MKIVQPTLTSIRQAAEIIRAGGLVIVPTETVYGIAADATNADAVAKIFKVKNRPTENPLIVHICELSMVAEFARAWTETAETLAERFWPGPLTIVVFKSSRIPEIVTGGLDTVALRMPENQIALDVIAASEVPLAAPSANRFTELSATRVEHLGDELINAVDMVIDGGPCRFGIESTVVDVCSDPIRIFRPGGVSRAEIEAALKQPLSSSPPHGVRRSPGMYARHYAPKAKLVLVNVLPKGAAGLTFAEAKDRQIHMPDNPVAYAANLYDSLFKIDKLGVEEIFVEWPPDSVDWEVVRDRLKKASA